MIYPSERTADDINIIFKGEFIMSEFAEGYAVGQGTNCNNGMGYGFGEWIWIIVLFALWQNGGFGMGGNCRANCATQADLAAGFNNSTVLSSLDDIKLGQANAINYNNQGFNGLNTAVLQGFNGVEKGFCDISHQISDCCCGTKAAISDLRYTVGQEACETRHALFNNTRDIIENANANSRAILDALTAQRIEAKDSKIAEQNQTIFGLQLAASQAAQNNYIVNQIRPAPVPAYQVANPYAGCYGACNPCGCAC